MAQSEKALRMDANIWIYDANALFTGILGGVKTFPQTAGITNTSDSCEAYAK
ncbi:hypothetical protein ACQKWADRAFT_287666 [Trichoderma austrokoningii]